MRDPGNLVVLGPGLLGGSLAMAARRHWPKANVSLWARRPEVLEEVRASGLTVDTNSDLAETVRDADLIILATPVEVMKPLAERIAECGIKQGCVVTDVGSVKAQLVDDLAPIVKKAGGIFVGSHPMAGSEQAGFSAARVDLFTGARCIVTPTESTPVEALETVMDFWRALDCIVVRLDPETHDQAVARISHLPHVAASAVVVAALEGATPEVERTIGSGFTDSTRIASGSPDLWVGILKENQKAVVEALKDLKKQVGEVLAMVEEMDEVALHRFLEHAKNLRDAAI